MTFGNAMIYLPLVHDGINAAEAIIRMELKYPCRGAVRRTTPAFELESGSLDHGRADSLFHALMVAALGEEQAAVLSLHSGRVWLACALLAVKKSDAVIQVLQRWKSPDSIRIYAKMQPTEYVGHLVDALDAHVTPNLAREAPTCDHDEEMALLESRRSTAAAPATPRGGSRAAATAPSTAGSGGTDGADRGGGDDADDDSSGDEDEGDIATPGPRMEVEHIVPGAAVAVCFYARDGSEQYFKGTVIRNMAVTALVKFREFATTFLDYTVAHGRIYHVHE